MKHTALDSLGLKQKGIRLWDEYVAKVINDTRENISANKLTERQYRLPLEKGNS
jgi:hypothetical protein